MFRQSVVAKPIPIPESKENPKALIDLTIEELTTEICKLIDQIHAKASTEGKTNLEKLKASITQLMANYLDLPRTLIPFKNLFENVFGTLFDSVIKSEDKLVKEITEFKNQLVAKYKPILPFVEIFSKPGWKPFVYGLVSYIKPEYFLESPEGRYQIINSLLNNPNKQSGFRVALETNRELAAAFLKHSVMNQQELISKLASRLGQSMLSPQMQMKEMMMKAA